VTQESAAHPFKPMTKAVTTGWGLIAGNGRFPFLVLEGARSQGIDMAVIALKEEASQELASSAKRLHWVSLGELSKAIDLMHREGVTHAVMAGQVKHNKIFSAIRPDWKLAKLLFSLPRKNTDSLIGAVAKVFEDEGIHLVDSTHFLKPLLPEAGVLTRRAPDERESADIAYGLGVARQVSAMDIGQTVVISDRACVAVEAMEGTDETIARAARIVSGKPLVVVKVSKPNQDMRFDVPVVGLPTIEQMKNARATAIAIDAGRTLLFDREKLIAEADAAGIAMQAFPFGAAMPNGGAGIAAGETSAGQSPAELGTASGGMKK
jgi:UDP-2,3-diacylglucosamine hydrolase